jgi:GNAT superfamily N-acetyltransferase
VEYSIQTAGVDDAPAIAALHAESWRSAYREFLPDAFLDGPVVDDRLRFWSSRMSAPDGHRRVVLKAVSGAAIVGFACVLLDAEPDWGALLDNLHVKPELKTQGIGRRLFEAARGWIAVAAPGARMHLTVIERNVNARRFYDRLGGSIVERRIVDVIPGTRLEILRYVWEPHPDESTNLPQSTHV